MTPIEILFHTHAKKKELSRPMYLPRRRLLALFLLCLLLTACATSENGIASGTFPSTSTRTLPTPTATFTPAPHPVTPTPTIQKSNPTPTPSTPVAHFSTLPPGSALPSDAQCAAEVRKTAENRPDNTAKNNVNEYQMGHMNTGAETYLAGEAPMIATRITGNFTGTTDEILQWGACKWGFDEDDVRAQAQQESGWHQSHLGDSAAQTQAGLAGHPSVGILQVKGGDIPPTHPGTWPYAWDSTAWNVDYTLAVRRACFEGKDTWLGNGYTAGDEWGCIGRWFSGAWHDAGAEGYISLVKQHLTNKDWLHPGF